MLLQLYAYRVAIHVEPILFIVTHNNGAIVNNTINSDSVYDLIFMHTAFIVTCTNSSRWNSLSREREWDSSTKKSLMWFWFGKLLCLLIACCWQTSIRMIWYLHLHLHCHHVYAYNWVEIIEVFEQYIYMHFHEVLNT